MLKYNNIGGKSQMEEEDFVNSGEYQILSRKTLKRRRKAYEEAEMEDKEDEN